jgi:hypothetical protein
MPEQKPMSPKQGPRMHACGQRMRALPSSHLPEDDPLLSRFYSIGTMLAIKFRILGTISAT